jgi:hypothetical protein
MKKREVLRQDHDDLVSYSIEPITGPACGVESSLSFPYLLITITTINDRQEEREIF